MTKGYIIDFGGTLDTNGCHWGRFLWHAYQQRQVPVGWQEFSEAYVHVERLLGKGSIIRPEHTLRQTLSIKLRLQMEHLIGKGYWYGAPLEMERYHAGVLQDVYDSVSLQMQTSRQVLARLTQSVPLVLCSNFYGNLPSVLREFELDGFFVAVCLKGEPWNYADADFAASPSTRIITDLKEL